VDEGAAGDNRLRIETTADGVRVELPGTRSWWAPVALALLVPVAAYVVFASLIFANAAVVTARELSPVLAAMFVVTLLLVPGVIDALVLIAAVVLLYHIWGREVVTASPWMLSDVRRVLLFSRHRHWPTLRVSNLRLSPMSGGPLDPGFVSRRGILLTVDDKRTRSIAEGCTPREAAEALTAIQDALTRPTITR
jgi:hypothetical protein